MLEPCKEGVGVDEWWAEVAEVTIDEERRFPNLSYFALALSTVPNSSSEVERDFSDMEAIFANSKAHGTGQELLEAKMTVKCAMKNEAANCARCIAAMDERKEKTMASCSESQV